MYLLLEYSFDLILDSIKERTGNQIVLLSSTAGTRLIGHQKPTICIVKVAKSTPQALRSNNRKSFKSYSMKPRSNPQKRPSRPVEQ